MNNIEIYDMNDNKLLNMFQWDSNQVLKITNIDNTENLMVHFWNKLSPTAYVVAPTVVDEHTITVAVPNILLQHAETIMVYLYATTGTESYKTTDDIKIPVKARPVPSDYEYVENIEYISINLLNQKYNELKEEVDDLPQNIISYSTEERKIGTWVDGSDLYEKSFTLDIKEKTEDMYQIDIPDSEILSCVDIKTYIICGNNTSIQEGFLINNPENFENGVTSQVLSIYRQRGEYGADEDVIAINFYIGAFGEYLYPAPYKVCVVVRYTKPITKHEFSVSNLYDYHRRVGSYYNYYALPCNFGFEVGDTWHYSIINDGTKVFEDDAVVQAGTDKYEGYNIISVDPFNTGRQTVLVDMARFYITSLSDDPQLHRDNISALKWNVNDSGAEVIVTIRKVETNEEE